MARTSHLLNVNSVMSLIPPSIGFYDYVLTLPMEIERFWQRPRATWATTLFFINRYFLVGLRIPFMILLISSGRGPNSWIYPSCRALRYYDQITIILSQLFSAALMTMRIYALYEKNRILLYAILVFAVITVIEACSVSLKITANKFPPAYVPLVACCLPVSSDQATHLAAAWSSQLAFDAIIFCLTWWKTWRIGSVEGRPLISILLRDGAVYFAVMTLAHVANILLLLQLPSPQHRGVGIWTMNVLTATMISRMMLNLRDPRLLDNSQPREDRSSLLLPTSILYIERPRSMISTSSLYTGIASTTDGDREDIDTGNSSP